MVDKTDLSSESQYFSKDLLDKGVLRPEERLMLTKPQHFGAGWSVTVLEMILDILRKNGRCLVEIEGGADEYVPTVAEILF